VISPAASGGVLAQFGRATWHTALVLWAGPWTLVGLIIGLFGVATGGKARRGIGTIEFHGGLVRRLLQAIPQHPLAMTLGHTVLALDEISLDVSRDHELVHVRQYERWGPLFVPAYFACWFVLALRGQDGYWDNPFEREAYNRSK
jgi:hypothetical protein